MNSSILEHETVCETVASEVVSTGQFAELNESHEFLVRILHEANRGNPAAQFAIGRALESGLLLSPDRNAATCWFESAAAQGWLPAIKKLAEEDRRS